MKRLVFLVFTLLVFNFCQGQLINSKVRVYFQYNLGKFQGKEIITDGNFTAPSLFVNYNNFTGYSLKGLININPLMSTGLVVEQLHASGWDQKDNADYFNSSISLYTVSAVIQIHNPYKEAGFSNRFKIYGEIAPVAGLSKLSLVNPLFDIRSNEYIVKQPLISNDFFYGIKETIGVEIAINQLAGICCSYSLSYNLISSRLYIDNHFYSAQFQVGAFVKLIKDKRFFY